MPTHDYIIANGTGAAVRADINLALSAIVSLNSSASEPATMYAYQLWADTALGLLKIRNSGNSAWITLRQLDGDFSIVAVEDGLQATPSLTFTNDLNTGVFRSGADALAIVTGGQYAITCTSTQAVGIKTANPNAALHVAGVARIGADDTTDAVLEIGAGATGNRESYIDLVGDTTYFDYGARFGRSAGANGITYFAHRGTGAISIQTTEAGPITFTTTGTERLRLSGSGDFVFKGAGTTPGTDKAVFFSTAAPINSMVLDSSGLVGIGTSSPQRSLHVQKQSEEYVRISGNRGDAADLHIGGIEFENSFNSQGVIAEIKAITGSSGTHSSKGQLAFYTDDGSSYGERVRIDSSGRLGIGTTSPGAALEINAAAATSPFIAKINTSEAARIDSSGRLLVGTTSADGLISNISPVVAGAFKSHSGSVSIAPSTTVTIFTIPASNGEGAYTVTAIYVNSNNTATFSAYAVILYEGSGTNAYRAMGFDGSLLSITVSGRDVQLTTGATYTQGIKWSFVKQAVA